MAASTSFRISDTARTRLASRATREGTTATALLDQLIIEGIDQLDYPGIIFRGPAHDRRAGVAACRMCGRSSRAFKNWRAAIADRSPGRRSRICIPDSSASPWTMPQNTLTRFRERIGRNQGMAERSHRMAQQRESLLA